MSDMVHTELLKRCPTWC